MLSNNTGSSNIGIGYQALNSNTSGGYNVAVGHYALRQNTTGGFSTAVGYWSLKNNTTGSNTGLGDLALYYNTSGNYNVAVGGNTLQGTTSVVASLGSITGGSGYTNGTYNNVTLTDVSGPMATAPTANITVSGGAVTSVTLVTYGTGVDSTTVLSAAAADIGGTGSGFSVPVASVTAGQYNTALGYQAGYTTTTANANVTGSYNTFLGYNSGPGSTTQLQNATAIGVNSVVSQSNSLVLGCASGTNGCTTNTKVGIDNATPSYTLDVAAR